MNNFKDKNNQGKGKQFVVIDNKVIKKDKKPLIVSCIYFGCVLLFLFFKILIQLGFLSGLDSTSSEIISSCIIQLLIIGFLPLVFYLILTKQGLRKTLAEFRFRKISAKSIVLSILIGLGVFFLVSFISTFFNTILVFFGAESVPTNNVEDASSYTIPMFFLTVLLSAILPAVFEEFLHRGMLLGTYSKYGVVFAIVTSSLAFGFLHMNIMKCFYAVAIGLFLGYVCIYTKSIIPCIIVHFMNNFINIFFDFSYVNGWLGGGYYAWQQQLQLSLGEVGVYFLGVVLFIASLILVVFCTYKLIKIERLDDEVKKMDESFSEEYEEIKQKAQLYGNFGYFSKMSKSKTSFFLYSKMTEAKRRSTTTLNLLENPNGNAEFNWYDNIFLFASIASVIFVCIISFLGIVI